MPTKWLPELVRKYIINRLIDAELSSNHLNDIMLKGFVGFNNMSDDNLIDKYEDFHGGDSELKIRLVNHLSNEMSREYMILFDTKGAEEMRYILEELFEKGFTGYKTMSIPVLLNEVASMHLVEDLEPVYKKILGVEK